MGRFNSKFGVFDKLMDKFDELDELKDELG